LCHTSTGAEWAGGWYAYLDLTALGRQEDWEEPKGRADSVRGATPSVERLIFISSDDVW